MEEAREELAKIEHHYPIWEQNPLESDSLLVVRRSFHTLAGSGRMVNARNISEFAWSIENLLSRLVDGTLPRSPAVLETLRATRWTYCRNWWPNWNQAIAGRTDVTALAARAHALASGRDGAMPAAHHRQQPRQLRHACAVGEAPAAAAPSGGAAVSEQSSPEHSQPMSQVAHEPPSDQRGDQRGDQATTQAWIWASPFEIDNVDLASLLDPEKSPEDLSDSPDVVLRDIYARETASHVGTVRRWLTRERQSGAPHVLPEEVYRACHTLVGSSTMAEARHGIRLAEPMNHWLRKAVGQRQAVSDWTTQDISLVGDCMSAMESVAGHLDEGTGFFVVA